MLTLEEKEFRARLLSVLKDLKEELHEINEHLKCTNKKDTKD